jgi:hypothetical protein
MATGSKLCVLDEALSAFVEARELQNRIENYTVELSERTDYDSESYHNL